MLSSDGELDQAAESETFMALIVVVLTGVAAGVLWLTRNRSMRTQWGLSAAMALFIWVITLAIRLGPDFQFELSVWQPSQLFRSPLRVSLDPITWPIIYSIATVLVSMIFTSASRASAPNPSVRVFWFLYAGSAILAVLADNLLTVIIAWAVFDFISAIFLFSLLRDEEEISQVITRISIDFIGILLVIAGSAFRFSAGEGADLREPITSTVSVILIAMGAFVRLGLLPLHFNLPGLMVARRGLGTLLRYFPPVVALSLLAKVFRGGVPDESLIIFIIAGVSGLLIGGVRWVLESDSVAGRPFFLLVMSGIGVFAAASQPMNYMGLVAASVVLLLVGAVLSLSEIFTPSHRIFPLGASVMLLVLPIFPAGRLLSVSEITLNGFSMELIWSVIILLGMASAALGSLHSYYAQEIPWRTGENLVRASYGLGLAMPILASIGIGFHILTDAGALAWIAAGVQIVLVVGGFLLLRNLAEVNLERLNLNLTRLDPSGLYSFLGDMLDHFLSGLRAIAELIEGEAALLWIFAIIVFLLFAAN